MTQIKTDSELLSTLEKAAKRTLSEDEIKRQRVSFIMGSVSVDEDGENPITRDEINEILDHHEGRKSA